MLHEGGVQLRLLCAHAQPFRKADFVIEAAPEDEEVKKAIFRKLDQVRMLLSEQVFLAVS